VKIWIKTQIDRPDLSDRVLQAIRDSGTNQAKVAKALSVSRQYFHKILAGETVVSVEMVRKIEEILGIDLGVGNG